VLFVSGGQESKGGKGRADDVTRPGTVLALVLTQPLDEVFQHGRGSGVVGRVERSEGTPSRKGKLQDLGHAAPQNRQ
jgi:hypothetical protein